MSRAHTLWRQAFALRMRLDTLRYQRLVAFARYPSARPDAANDPRVVQLTRLAERAEVRIGRRVRAWQAEEREAE